MDDVEAHKLEKKCETKLPGSLCPMAMASVVVRHRPPLRGMSAFTVAVRKRSNCEGTMPNSLLEYVAEGSMPVTASILVMRALVRFRASLEIFLARSQAFFHRLVCFGIRLRPQTRDRYPGQQQTRRNEQGNQRSDISAPNVWRGLGPW